MKNYSLLQETYLSNCFAFLLATCNKKAQLSLTPREMLGKRCTVCLTHEALFTILCSFEFCNILVKVIQKSEVCIFIPTAYIDECQNF